jgi:antitoxin HicB
MSSAPCCKEGFLRRYSVVIFRDPQTGQHTVSVPALPGCYTLGATVEEALANAQDAIRLYLADVEASGEPVPTEAAPPQVVCVAV